MKQLLTLIIGLLFTSYAYADCAGNGISVFPKGKDINQNSIFIINGFEESQKIILKLNKKHNVYLKSGEKKIKLLVTETYVGQFSITQAVLKPETKLEMGLEYELHIDNLPEYEEFNRYNEKTQQQEPIKYKVVNEDDFEKPKLSSKPKELEKRLAYFGCGPAMHVVFSNPAKDKSEIIVKTTVKNLKTNKETTYIIEPYGEKISVGHGMCGGAFTFDNGNDYEIEFAFMDSSGNTTTWTGNRIKFTKPTKETNYDEE